MPSSDNLDAKGRQLLLQQKKGIMGSFDPVNTVFSCKNVCKTMILNKFSPLA